jgi:arylsulfatase
MADRPNLILIITDHWRGDCLGRLGHAVAETPHLDSLSANGVTFRRGYTPSPSCTPARRCLMTGMTPASTGMIGYADGKPWDYRHTFAGELTQAGYQTINVGKTHFHPSRKHLGFEQLFTSEDYKEWLKFQPDAHTDHHAHGVPGNSWIARPNHLPERMMEETWFVNTALDRLQKRDPTRPFFLCLSFNGPHPPWCPPAVYYEQFIDRPLPPPVVGEWSEHHATDVRYPLDANSWRGRIAPHLNQRARAAYFGYLSFLDAQVGRLMDFIGRGGMGGNTMIAFTADHGEMLGDHNLWRKTYAYEPSARIPFIVVPPRPVAGPRNVESDALVGWEDLMPTFLEAAGVAIPDTVEGRSLMPLLRGETPEWRDWYHHEHGPCYAKDNAYQCLTSHEWKYIWNPITGAEQLFNLLQDPTECHDLAPKKAHAKTLKLWRGRLAKHLANRPEQMSDGKNLKVVSEMPIWRQPVKNV